LVSRGTAIVSYLVSTKQKNSIDLNMKNIEQRHETLNSRETRFNERVAAYLVEPRAVFCVRCNKEGRRH